MSSEESVEPRGLALCNLDFEDELASGPRYRPGVKAQATADCWRFILRLLPGAQRAACLADPSLSTEHRLAFEGDSRLTVWGVTPRILQLARELGMESHFPTVDVVRQVNSKLYSHGLEGARNIALPHSQPVQTMDQLMAAIEGCPHDWVLKHPLGFSGRERMVGRRAKISDSASGWAARKIAAGWTLLFEPWVEGKREFSMHLEVDPSGAVHWLGHCGLVSDSSGVFRGNRILASEEVDDTARWHAIWVAEELSRQGYWGPLGIDAFTGTLGGCALLRPLVEINARCSFGRLALAMGQGIPDGWSYFWWHPRRADFQRLSEAHEPLPWAGVTRPGIYSLPTLVDPRSQSGTLVLVSPTAEHLAQLEASLQPS